MRGHVIRLQRADGGRRCRQPGRAGGAGGARRRRRPLVSAPALHGKSDEKGAAVTWPRTSWRAVRQLRASAASEITPRASSNSALSSSPGPAAAADRTRGARLHLILWLGGGRLRGCARSAAPSGRDASARRACGPHARPRDPPPARDGAPPARHPRGADVFSSLAMSPAEKAWKAPRVPAGRPRGGREPLRRRRRRRGPQGAADAADRAPPPRRARAPPRAAATGGDPVARGAAERDADGRRPLRLSLNEAHEAAGTPRGGGGGGAGVW